MNEQQEHPTSGPIPWRYSIPELWADGAVHAVGIALAVAGTTAFAAAMLGRHVTVPVATGVYLTTLVLSIGISAVYNLWPVSRAKWLLRRLDHSAIYLLIAGTYTPFMAKLGTWWLLSAVWSAAVPGVILKLFQPGRFDRLSIVLCLAIGWSGIVIGDRLIGELSPEVLWLIGLGGLAYTAGVGFYLWQRLKFQNAIWHGFVLAASALFFGAVWAAVQT